MPKHDPPGDDAALLELERELMELDRAIRAADENREAINYALFERDELMARIFTTPAAGLAGLAVQARAYLSEREVEFADSEGEGPLDFPHMDPVLAHGILALADPVAGWARWPGDAEQHSQWIENARRRNRPDLAKHREQLAAPIEPVIGHLKEYHRMGRNYFAHASGDAINPVLAAAG
jgi:hypothetical protein